MKKIFVTGYNGFIGALLVKLLKEKGYDVTGLDTSYYGPDCEFFHENPDEGITVIRKDMRQLTASDLEGMDAVCHLAALSNDTLGKIDPELTYDINYRASVELARLSKKVGVSKFIYSSSCSLYGKAGDEALTEEADFNPITAYAKSKVMTEREILPMADSGFCVTSMRNATAYGISPKLRMDLVVNDLVGWAIVTKQIKILSDGTPWRPLVHAEDIARAFIAVIEAPVKNVSGEAFNVGQDSENFQVKDIARMVGEVIPGCEIVITGEHGSDSRSYRVDFGKIKRMLPEFKPRWTLREGIKEVYEAYKTYGMDNEKFMGRYFVRLRQIQFLMDSGKVNNELYWNPSARGAL
jgi:nucleoside-diphosphate-sugar epimerase